MASDIFAKIGDIKGESLDGWHPEQAVSREQALKMFTVAPAYAAFEEKDKGSIEPGKLADMVVISKDYLRCPVDEIKDIEALRTVVGGKVVYDRLQ